MAGRAAISREGCPGHPRLWIDSHFKTWMPGTRPGMTARRSRPLVSRRRELHLRERRAAEEAVGIRRRRQHFEMVVAFADDELHRLAGGLHRRVEIAGLALELGRLFGALRAEER